MAGRKRSTSTRRKPRRKRRQRKKNYQPAEPLRLTSEEAVAGLQKIINRMSEHRRREYVDALARRGDLLDRPAQGPKPPRDTAPSNTSEQKSP